MKANEIAKHLLLDKTCDNCLYNNQCRNLSNTCKKWKVDYGLQIGSLFLDKKTNKLKVWNGHEWKERNLNEDK